MYGKQLCGNIMFSLSIFIWVCFVYLQMERLYSLALIKYFYLVLLNHWGVWRGLQHIMQ